MHMKRMEETEMSSTREYTKKRLACMLLGAVIATACGPAELAATEVEPEPREARQELDEDTVPVLRPDQAAALACAPSTGVGYTYNVASYGAFGNGVTDDRSAIQAAVNAAIGAGGGTVWIPGNPDGSKRVYLLSVVDTVSGDPAALYIYGGATGVTPVNLRIVMAPGVRLKVIATSRTRYGLIYIRRASNVSISGGHVVGDKNANFGYARPQGHGIVVDRSLNVQIDSVKVSRFPGDGIYINTHPEEAWNPAGSDAVTVCKSIIFDNSRTGVALISVDGVLVRDSLISDTRFPSGYGGDWQAGVDIEPNPAQNGVLQFARDILFQNTDVRGNAGAGLMMYSAFGPISDVRFRFGILESNGQGYLNSGGYWVYEKNVVIGTYNAPYGVSSFRIDDNTLRKGTGLGDAAILVQAGSSGRIRYNDLTTAGPLHILSSSVTVCGNTGLNDPDC
jgi:hypothetical protein